MIFLRKVFTYFFPIFSLICLIYIFYKSQIILEGKYNEEYSTFFLFCIFLLIFSLIFIFLNNSKKDYFIIFFLSFIFAIYAYEFYLSNLHEPYEYREYRINTGKEYDKRKIIQIYEELNKNDNYSVPVYPNNHLKYNNNLFPLSGISNSKTIHCNENGYYSIYESDRYGFNNPDEEWNKNEIEFILIGDSFAHGACVNRPNDIGSKLRNISNKSVINLGYGGTGPLAQYATLREYFKRNIKKVIWIYFEGNDLLDLNNEIKNPILLNYLSDKKYSQNLINNQNILDIFLIDLINHNYSSASRSLSPKKNIAEEQSRILKFVKLQKTRSIIRHYVSIIDRKKKIKNYNYSLYNFKKPKEKILLDIFENIIVSSKELVGKEGGELYFVYIPSYDKFKFKINNTYFSNIKKIIKKNNIFFIDIHKEFIELIEDPISLYPFRTDQHFTSKGYELISKIIYENIK